MNDTRSGQLWTNKAQHLDDEQFCECLAKEPSRQTAAHLELCEPCQMEVQRALTSISDVRKVGRQWSETRAASTPRFDALLRRPAHGLRAAFAGGMLAIVAPAGIYLAMHLENRDQAQAKAQQSQRTQEIARDNQLLLAVNEELDESVAPAMQPLLLSSPGPQQGTTGTQVKQEGQRQ